MGVPGSEKRRLSRQVLVRLPPDAAAKIAEIARTEGITSASWMRRVAVTALGESGESTALAVPPVKAKRTSRPFQPRHVIEIARIRAGLTEAADALGRSAALIRGCDYSAALVEIEASLPIVCRSVRDLDRAKLSLMRRPGNA